MTTTRSTLARDYSVLVDTDLVACVQAGDREAFRHLMTRSNQRLFRMARGVLNDDAEAEDAVQAAYVDAYAKLDTFRGESSVLTCITRIVLYDAYGRLRQRHPTVDVKQLEVAQMEPGRILSFPSRNDEPAASAARDQIRRLLERAIEQLPEPFRLVFVMREIEDCSVEETAMALDLRPETVKTRLHRARRLLRAALHDTLASSLGDAFPFLGARCDRMTMAVMQQLSALDETKPD
jgi:RNA polymerase sigma-70 factor (ECF subfamily)